MDNFQIPSYWVKVDGLDIHYKRLGKGSPVILIHGGHNDWREWQINLPFLAQWFCVYALDLPGFGLSDSPGPLSFSWMASFLNNFMRTLEIAGAHIIGHSLGGMLAIKFALDFPEMVKRVVLVDSAGLGEVSPAGQVLLTTIKGIKKVFGKNKEPEYKASSKQDWILVNRLKELRQPVMIAWGGWDLYLPISQARSAQSLIPNCQLYAFRRCRHAPHRENPERFNNLVFQFLEELYP